MFFIKHIKIYKKTRYFYLNNYFLYYINMSKNIFIDNIEYTIEQVLNNKELYKQHLKKLKYERDKARTREINRRKLLENPEEIRRNNREYVKKRYHTNEEYRTNQLKKYKMRRDKIRELRKEAGEYNNKPRGRPRIKPLKIQDNESIKTRGRPKKAQLNELIKKEPKPRGRPIKYILDSEGNLTTV